MSRFHNKWHRHNHHTNPTGGGNYPDSSHDPIASHAFPFQGTFVTQGTLSAAVPAGVALTTTGSNILGGDVAISGYTTIGSDLVVAGDFTVQGTTTTMNTNVVTTSALNISNTGTGPALTVTQLGDENIVAIYNDTAPALFVTGTVAKPGWVGIGTDSPTTNLSVSGSSNVTDDFSVGKTITAPLAVSTTETSVANVSALKTIFSPIIVDVRGEGGQKYARFNANTGSSTVYGSFWGTYRVSINSENGAGGSPTSGSAIVSIRKIYDNSWTVDFTPETGPNRLVLTIVTNTNTTLDFNIAIVSANSLGGVSSNRHSVTVTQIVRPIESFVPQSVVVAAWSTVSENRATFLDGTQVIPDYTIAGNIINGVLTVSNYIICVAPTYADDAAAAAAGYPAGGIYKTPAGDLKCKL